MHILYRIDSRLRVLHPTYLILIAFAAMLATSAFLGLFVEVEPRFTDKHWVYMLIVGVVIAPLAETFIFQKLPIELGIYLQRKVFKKVYSAVNVLLSSLAFALTHPYGIGYVVFAFLFGLIFSYVYVVRYKATSFTSFTVVWILHAAWNGLVLTIQHV